MQPLLLMRPRLLGIKNALFSRRSLKRPSQREFVFSTVSLLLILSVYHAASSSFASVRQYAPVYGLQPDLPIALFFSLLSGMILLSGAAAALGTFYLGNDLDFLISKPMTSMQFLLGKGAETILQSSWMMLVFGLPVLAGIGHAYEMPLTFYALGILTVIPIISIPTLVGITTISLIIRIIPPRKARECLFVAASILILYIYLTAKNFMVGNSGINPNDMTESLRQLVKVSSSKWLPSAWAATVLGDFLTIPLIQVSTAKYLLLLYTVTAASALAAYGTLRTIHFDAFSSAKSTPLGTKIYSGRFQKQLTRYLFFLSPNLRALWAKEMKLFGRDLTQGLQLIMLLGICLIYLYNFNIVHQIGQIKPEVLLWWKSTLLICNIGMGSFIITAISSRFVFPCLSLEGNSFWVIRSAPVSLNSLLRWKFWIWYLPISSISCVILVSGAMAIDVDPQTVVITGLISWIICFGLVSLGIGLGAFFAHFDWESAPQVTSSFGNFVYMLAGTLLIAINLIPITILAVIATIRQSGIPISDSHWGIAICSTAAALCYLNYLTYRFSLKMGAEALSKKT